VSPEPVGPPRCATTDGGDRVPAKEMRLMRKSRDSSHRRLGSVRDDAGQVGGVTDDGQGLGVVVEGAAEERNTIRDRRATGGVGSSSQTHG
jgi:hypothetical protein